jgi:hypothetical protein
MQTLILGVEKNGKDGAYNPHEGGVKSPLVSKA